MADLRAILYREFRLFTRDRINLFLGILPAAAYLLLFATSISNVIQQVAYRGQLVDYKDFAIPAIMISSMLAGATTAATSVFQEEQGGMILELWSAPIRRSSYIWGKLLATTALVLIQGIVTLIVAMLVFRETWPLVTLGTVLLAALITSLALNGIYLFAATQMRDLQKFLIAINVAFSIAFFGSPSFYPLEAMPQPLQYLARINPVTYGVSALRDGLLFDLRTSWPPLVVLIVLALGFGGLATWSLLARFRDL